MGDVFKLPTLTKDEHVLGVSGDWHGNCRWAVTCINRLGEAGVKTVFSLGDFGIWQGSSGDEYLGKLRKALEKYGMTIYVTLGNHENYNLVDNHEADEMGIKWFRHNIGILPRVFRFEHRGVTFLSLGGAPSIDFESRVKDVDWWPQEMLTNEEIDEAIEGGTVDVMLAHDAPENGTLRVQQIVDSNPMGWSRTALSYAAIGRERMTRAVQGIKPQVFLHGHYHTRDSGWLSYGEDEEYPGIIHSLHCDGFPGNIATLNTDDIYDEIKELKV